MKLDKTKLKWTCCGNYICSCGEKLTSEQKGLAIDNIVKVEQRELLIALVKKGNSDMLRSDKPMTAENTVDEFLKSNGNITTEAESETPVICPDCKNELTPLPFSKGEMFCEKCEKAHRVKL